MAKRDRKLEFSASEFEEKEFKSASELRGMSLSAWIRDACRNQTLTDRAKARRDAALSMSDEDARKLSTFDSQLRKASCTPQK